MPIYKLTPTDLGHDSWAFSSYPPRSLRLENPGSVAPIVIRAESEQEARERTQRFLMKAVNVETLRAASGSQSPWRDPAVVEIALCEPGEHPEEGPPNQILSPEELAAEWAARNE